jgi:hypothetical protein
MTDGESGRLEPAGQLSEVIAAAGPRGRGQPDQLPIPVGAWPNRVTVADRASPGPLDAVSAARAAQSGRARSAPKGRDGAVEAIRALMVARRSAVGVLRTWTSDEYCGTTLDLV